MYLWFVRLSFQARSKNVYVESLKWRVGYTEKIVFTFPHIIRIDVDISEVLTLQMLYLLQ